MQLTFRPATLADVSALKRLIRVSVQELQPEYTAEQRERALDMVFGVDTQLIEDGTYFVATASEEGNPATPLRRLEQTETLFGSDHCAGREDGLLDPARDAARIRAFFVHPEWARRGIGSRLLEVCESAAGKAGFRRLEMGATLAGVPLYRRAYIAGEQCDVPLGQGISLPIIYMVKQLP